VASAALIQLSKEVEMLEVMHADLHSEDYPFSVCLLNAAQDMQEWQDKINLLEEMKSAKTIDS